MVSLLLHSLEWPDVKDLLGVRLLYVGKLLLEELFVISWFWLEAVVLEHFGLHEVVLDHDPRMFPPFCFLHHYAIAYLFIKSVKDISGSLETFWVQNELHWRGGLVESLLRLIGKFRISSR